ncbi:hypothetical protein quinque_015687 [Culex quinquefasciatus]
MISVPTIPYQMWPLHCQRCPDVASGKPPGEIILQLRVKQPGKTLPLEPFRAGEAIRCCQDVDHLDDEELLHELAAQGVSGIYRHPAAAKPAGREQQLNASGQPFRYSGLMVLTVRGTSQPTHVKFGPLRVVARPYRMHPLQCRRCWRFGHKEVRCPDLAAGKNPVCGRCSERHPPAVASEANDGSGGTCQKPARCSRCGNGAAHGVGSPKCPIYQREAEIADFRTGMAGGGSFAAAAQAVEGLRERKHQPQQQQQQRQPKPQQQQQQQLKPQQQQPGGGSYADVLRAGGSGAAHEGTHAQDGVVPAGGPRGSEEHRPVASGGSGCPGEHQVTALIGLVGRLMKQLEKTSRRSDELVCGRCSERHPPAVASEANDGSGGTCQKPARCSRCGNGAAHGVGSPKCPIYQREAEIADFRTGMAGGGSFAAAAQAVDSLRERKCQPQPQQRWSKLRLPQVLQMEQ